MTYQMKSGWISPFGVHYPAILSTAEEVARIIDPLFGSAGLERRGYVWAPKRKAEGVPTRYDGNQLTLGQLLELMWLGFDLEFLYVHEKFHEPEVVQ